MVRIAWLAMLTACESHVVRVVPDGLTAGTTTAPSDPTFEVVARVAGVHDPLPVSGSGVEYSDLETALGSAVLRLVVPRHDSVLAVELVAGDASYRDDRLSISLVARATLRTREGNAYIGQTQVVCRDSAFVAADAGSRVVWSCLTHLGQDLGGWLEGLPH
jgi:hypothetical protein